MELFAKMSETVRALIGEYSQTQNEMFHFRFIIQISVVAEGVIVFSINIEGTKTMKLPHRLIDILFIYFVYCCDI